LSIREELPISCFPHSHFAHSLLMFMLARIAFDMLLELSRDYCHKAILALQGLFRRASDGYQARPLLPLAKGALILAPLLVYL
jgi:hypothetical protein